MSFVAFSAPNGCPLCGEEPAQQHQQILECALRRDAATAKAVLVAHVNNCVEHAWRTGSLG